jgi:hypothetical protein
MAEKNDDHQNLDPNAISSIAQHDLGFGYFVFLSIGKHLYYSHSHGCVSIWVLEAEDDLESQIDGFHGLLGCHFCFPSVDLWDIYAQLGTEGTTLLGMYH